MRRGEVIGRKGAKIFEERKNRRLKDKYRRDLEPADVSDGVALCGSDVELAVFSLCKLKPLLGALSHNLLDCFCVRMTVR